MVGGVTGVERDVIPYGSVLGDRARLSGLNIVGMQRRGFSRDEIQALRTAYQMLFGGENGTFAERLDAVERPLSRRSRPVREVLDFIRADSSRGLVPAEARMAAKLGILAGAGELPLRVVEACRAAGRPVFVLAFEGVADPARVRWHAACVGAARRRGRGPAAACARTASRNW